MENSPMTVEPSTPVEKSTPMTIKISRDEDDPDFCMVKIENNNVPFEIETRLSIQDNGDDEFPIQDWVRSVKNSRDRIIGISVERSVHYKNNNSCYFRLTTKAINSGPFEIVQLCVGNQCLLYHPSGYKCYRRDPPKALREFLSDDKFTCVGVGMKEVVKNLEEHLGLKIPRAKDLQEMAELLDHNLQEKNKMKKLSLEKLAKRVLKEDWTTLKNRNGISWWGDEVRSDLTDDKVKYGALDAFLAYKIGKKLIKSSNN